MLMAADFLIGRSVRHRAPAADRRDVRRKYRDGERQALFHEPMWNWFQDAVLEKSVIVGRRQSKVVGYVVGSSLATNAHVTIIQTMLLTFLPAPGCYLYGPICVAETERERTCRSHKAANIIAFLSR
jgi:hypothetical protein